MKVFYALAPAELERFYIFRDMESRVRADLSVELIDKIKAEVYADREAEGTIPPYSVKDGIACIVIEGTLTAKVHISDDLYGDVTTYSDIELATRAADADPMVREIHYAINSPGGGWDGVDYCAEVIKTATKPTTAIVYSSAQSGGYYLASQADKVLAVTKGSLVGSIGVAAEIFDRTEEQGKKGIKRLIFTNSQSTDKRPDANTDAGAAVIQEELDALYAVFEGRVVEGRQQNIKDFTAENVRQLKGRSVTAVRALEIGLIDGILSEEETKDEIIEATDTGGIMTLQEFLAENVSAKAEYDALTTSRQSYVEVERGRVLEIITLSGVSVPAPAQKAIELGTSAESYAKDALVSLRASLATSNASALGNPKPQIDVSALVNGTTGKVENPATEAELREWAKGRRG
jgi:ClpP class serine protease